MMKIADFTLKIRGKNLCFSLCKRRGGNIENAIIIIDQRKVIRAKSL